MGGRVSFDSAALKLGLAGVIGFYGFPGGPARNDTPAPTDIVGEFECPVLGIFGGADAAIPIDVIGNFRNALGAARIEHEIVVEPDAPHSFFDRKQSDFQVQSDDAWGRVTHFLRHH
jgi:carboxymethylenebutenolidase